MPKRIPREAATSERFPFCAALPSHAGRVVRFARSVCLALYMVDPMRDAFDAALVTEYCGGTRSTTREGASPAR
jgi:hypothetical protein